MDPDENEYFCSEIPTTPDLTSFLSTWYGCLSESLIINVNAQFSPILQTAMFSGTWYIVIEGLTFAYVRTFTLTVGVPTTIIVSLSNKVFNHANVLKGNSDKYVASMERVDTDSSRSASLS